MWALCRSAKDEGGPVDTRDGGLGGMGLAQTVTLKRFARVRGRSGIQYGILVHQASPASSVQVHLSFHFPASSVQHTGRQDTPAAPTVPTVR